jgi:uncharacterized membrane protein YebE (DUF533 family)
MDLNRVLGALLGGAAQPQRRRRKTGVASLLGGRGGNAQLVRALGTVAGAAVEAMMRSREAPPAQPAPAQRPAGRPWGGDAPAPARRLPEAGGTSPWATRPAAPAPVEPEAPDAEAAEALLLVRATIAAAKADGTVDAEERRTIAAQLDAAGLDAEERDFVLADLDRPMTPEALAKQATDPMLRARLYAAAFAGAGEVTPAERAWLDALAKALRLDKAAAAAIESRLGA